MSNVSTGASSLAQYDAARRAAALSGAAAPVTPSTQPAPTVTAATVQAQQAAVQVQPKPEVFNAPMLDLPPGATTREVMAGLQKGMADPTVNGSSVNKLYELHEMLMQAEKAMTQVIVDGMLM